MKRTPNEIRETALRDAGPLSDFVFGLYLTFEEANALHWQDRLTTPYVALEKFNPGRKWLGRTIPLLNGGFQITIDETVITYCREKDRLQFAKMILSHEMIHQAAFQILGWAGPAGAHSGWFSVQCNRLGAFYGWRRVRSGRKYSSKKRRTIPDCQHWPLQSIPNREQAIFADLICRARNCETFIRRLSTATTNETRQTLAREILLLRELTSALAGGEISNCGQRIYDMLKNDYLSDELKEQEFAIAALSR